MHTEHRIMLETMGARQLLLHRNLVRFLFFFLQFLVFLVEGPLREAFLLLFTGDFRFANFRQYRYYGRSWNYATNVYMHCHYDDVIKWKHFPRYWPFMRGIHRSPVNSPHKGQWRRALMFSLICIWINGWVNNREAGDLRRHRAHFDVTVMMMDIQHCNNARFVSINGRILISNNYINFHIDANQCVLNMG